jgi:hypothetical protein
MSEKDVTAAPASSSEGHISRRDRLKLVAAGMAASLLPRMSRAQTLSESLQVGSHGVLWTHAEQINSALVRF